MGKKYLKSLSVKSKALPAGAGRWNQNSEDLNWKNVLKKCFKTTVDTQLRRFQIRLVHRILATGRFLFLRKIIDSPLCAMCSQEEETITLWMCQVTVLSEKSSVLYQGKMCQLQKFRTYTKVYFVCCPAECFHR